MTDTITITLDDEQAQRAFAQMIQRAEDMTPLMRRIAGHLADVAEESFATEKSPDGVPWVDLAEITKVRRGERGHWPGQKLQVDGTLARSITTEFGRDYAQIGSNVPYARIHQLGGKAGRGRKVTILERPYLGVSAEARAEIAADAVAWLDLRRFA